MDQHLLTVALRILDAYAQCTPPDAADVELLRQAVPEPESQQTPDALAVLIVERELTVVRMRHIGPA